MAKTEIMLSLMYDKIIDSNQKTNSKLFQREFASNKVKFRSENL